MLYSAMTGGFYVAGVHKQIPADAVEITAEQHRSMLQSEVEGVPIKDRSPSLSLDQMRDRKIAEIDAARDAALEAGFLFGGVRYDCDDLSVQRITGAAVLGILNPAFETPWITFDNSVVTLSASDLAGLGAAEQLAHALAAVGAEAMHGDRVIGGLDRRCHDRGRLALDIENGAATAVAVSSRLRQVEQQHQDRRPLDVSQEPVTQPPALGGALMRRRPRRSGVR